VNELPKALTLSPDAFLAQYQFQKPGPNDLVITSCRSSKRATWAAHLLSEAGYSKVFVHRTGTYGWQFSSSVKPYDEYYLGDEIPPPKEFTKDIMDPSAGLKELEDLGLLTTKHESPNVEDETESFSDTSFSLVQTTNDTNRSLSQ